MKHYNFLENLVGANLTLSNEVSSFFSRLKSVIENNQLLNVKIPNDTDKKVILSISSPNYSDELIYLPKLHLVSSNSVDELTNYLQLKFDTLLAELEYLNTIEKHNVSLYIKKNIISDFLSKLNKSDYYKEFRVELLKDVTKQLKEQKNKRATKRCINKEYNNALLQKSVLLYEELNDDDYKSKINELNLKTQNHVENLLSMYLDVLGDYVKFDKVHSMNYIDIFLMKKDIGVQVEVAENIFHCVKYSKNHNNKSNEYGFREKLQILSNIYEDFKKPISKRTYILFEEDNNSTVEYENDVNNIIENYLQPYFSFEDVKKTFRTSSQLSNKRSISSKLQNLLNSKIEWLKLNLSNTDNLDENEIKKFGLNKIIDVSKINNFGKGARTVNLPKNSSKTIFVTRNVYDDILTLKEVGYNVVLNDEYHDLHYLVNNDNEEDYDLIIKLKESFEDGTLTPLLLKMYNISQNTEQNPRNNITNMLENFTIPLIMGNSRESSLYTSLLLDERLYYDNYNNKKGVNKKPEIYENTSTFNFKTPVQTVTYLGNDKKSPKRILSPLHQSLSESLSVNESSSDDIFSDEPNKRRIFSDSSSSSTDY